MADFDVRAFDDDEDDHTNDFDPVTDEGWFIPTDFAALGAIYPFFLKHYNADESAEIGATGTGLFNPFLNMNGDSTLVGFNTNDGVNNTINNNNGTDISDPNTDAIQLGDIPIIYQDLDGDGTDEAYYVINLDINENVNSEVSLEELQLFTSSASATMADYHFDEGSALAFANNGGDPATDFTLRFDLDATGDNKLIMRDDGAGQGKLDYTFYFPVEMFAGSTPDTYLTLFSQFGPNPADDAGFAEWNVLAAARISGTKFLDVNGDGVRDEDGADDIAGNSDDEVGLAGFTMYIDINGNNKLDANEQTALTDADGNFEFGSLLPDSTYIVREVLTAADVNGPGDPGTDVNFADYDPPAGLWDQTTDDGTGDQVVEVTTGTTNILVGNQLLVPELNIVKDVTSITGGQGTDGLDGADSDGDVINYLITVENTGDVTLTGVTVTDPNADPGSIVRGADIVGDNDDDLEVGEKWSYTATHTVTQAELDGQGIDADGVIDGDGDVDNIATADSDQTGPDTDPAVAPLIYDPDFTIDKQVLSVTGGDDNGTPGDTTDDKVDSAGDTINYAIVIQNTGNVTLTGADIDDLLEGQPFDIGAVVQTGGATLADATDNELDVGETWTYNFSHTVDQAEIDEECDEGDEQITNSVTAGFAEIEGTKSDTVNTPILCAPAIDLIKYVDVGFGFDDANTGPGPENVNVGGDVDFKITLENTGNVTLTDVDVIDTYLSGGAPGTPNLLIDDGVLTQYAIDHGAVLSEDVDTNGVLDVGETWTITYTEAFDPLSFDPGEHLNTADVTTFQGATDEDSAYYFSLVDTGLCPRTPGFWQNMNNGGQFWDGVQGNEKNAGEDGFPDGELLYAVDSDGDGNINVGVKGLLIGDYNYNGLTDLGEDTLFVSYGDALKLINASNKQLNGLSGDGKFMLGRDMVASWLNNLQGSGFGDASDPQSPHHYLDDAIDWMQIYSGNTAGGTTETFDTFKLAGPAIKTSSATWNTPQSGIDHSASQMHSALDYYNNTGQTEPGGTHYANCASEHLFEALSIFQQSHELV